MSKGPAAPNSALLHAGNAKISLRTLKYPNPVGSRASITFLIPVARTSSVSIPASNHVGPGTFAVIVPPSADRAVSTTVANVAARRHARRATSHVHGHVLIKSVQSLVDR